MSREEVAKVFEYLANALVLLKRCDEKHMVVAREKVAEALMWMEWSDSEEDDFIFRWRTNWRDDGED